MAERLASIDMDNTRALHTYALRHGDGVMNREEFANAIFGAEARQLAADNQMQLDDKTLGRVAKELVNVGKAFGELAVRRLFSADRARAWGTLAYHNAIAGTDEDAAKRASRRDLGAPIVGPL